MMIRYDDMMIVQHTNSASLSIKYCNIGVLLLHVTGTTHNVVGLVNNTSAATPRSDLTEQIEEWSLSFIVAVLSDGDYSRQCGQDFMATPSHDRQLGLGL